MAKNRELKTRKDGIKQHYNTGTSVTSNADARAAMNPRPAKGGPVVTPKLNGYEPEFANLVALGAFAQRRYGAEVASKASLAIRDDDEWAGGDKRTSRVEDGIERSYKRLDEKITSGMRFDRNWLGYGGDTSESARAEYEEVREAVIATETKRLAKKLGVTEAEVKSRVDSVMKAIDDED